MKKKMKTFLIVCFVIAAIVVVKAVLFFTAKPKIVVDYQAQINALSKPPNYEPNKDGFNYLAEASGFYVNVPADKGVEWERWSQEMSEAGLSSLKTWLAANSDAFVAYKKAGECDYIWTKYKEHSDSSRNSSLRWLPENETSVNSCLFWNAKLKAYEGNFNEVLESLLSAWKVAAKSINSNSPLATQMGIFLSKQQNVLDNAVEIIDAYRPPADDLEKWQKEWQKQFESDSYVPGLEGERLECYDYIQSNFVHKKNGRGRLYWKYLNRFDSCCEDDSRLSILLIPITGLTESDMRELVDSAINRYKDLIMKLPWEVRYPEQQYVQFQETCYSKWQKILVDHFVPPLHSYNIFYHRVKMRQDALITILAILRFNAKHGQYPSSLDELVQEGFLTKLPRDPFSRGPLFYNKLDDDFELYSTGQDFTDDGGKRFWGWNFLRGADYGDEVFWPPLRKGRKNIKFISTKELGL